LPDGAAGLGGRAAFALAAAGEFDFVFDNALI